VRFYFASAARRFEGADMSHAAIKRKHDRYAIFVGYQMIGTNRPDRSK
jgi:hypothetical protein